MDHPQHCLKFKTPIERSTGQTPDISEFRFYFCEPVWHFVPANKFPKPNMLKGRHLALAESAGDAMTYHILTEPDDTDVKRQVLMRSVVETSTVAAQLLVY